MRLAAENNPALKHLKLASLLSGIFHDRGIELVVVGGSAIEFYTEGEYPAAFPPARECANKLIAAALLNEVQTDWGEVRRLAGDPAYQNWDGVKKLVHEQAHALQARGPYDPDE